ncbi:MAG: hypothetical protein HY516_01285 [Candidatus Aenigmarchaeota archaeon]|nr:hypothetical protein [Candidatus Aenigmarchaeota archaeon]
MRTPPSYTNRVVSEAGRGPGYTTTSYTGGSRQGPIAYYRGSRPEYVPQRGYTGLRIFRLSRRRPRKLSSQKSGCSYCGGKPADKPVFAVATVVGRIGEVKKTLSPHCANCGVAVA